MTAHGIVSRREWAFVVLVVLALSALAAAPYVNAAVSAAAGRVRHASGALISAQDTNSYFAKMRQGYAGNWRFRLAYSSEAQRGIVFFTPYLALGHLARATGIPIIPLFHVARVASGAVLLVSLYALAARLTEDLPSRRWAFAVASIGSGLGFYALLFGHGESADLTIPEANTFFSILANPHFPLSASVAIWTLLAVFDGEGITWRRLASVGILGVLLVQLSMVLLPALSGGLVCGLAATYRRKGAWRAAAILTALFVAVGGASVAAYYVTSQQDPVVAAWTAQNVTPSPPVWDYLLGAGALLPLALAGFWRMKECESPLPWALAGWLAAAAVLAYFPHPLQRRLVGGVGVPLGMLAGLGAARLTASGRRVVRIASVLGLLLLAAPTNLMLLAALQRAPVEGGAFVYLTADEAAALRWLGESATAQDVVLASPEMGNFIPAHSPAHVVYGHPFETVDAVRREAAARAYFAGELNADAAATLFAQQHVTYVFVGPRERALGGGPLWMPAEADPVFTSGNVAIFAFSASLP